MLIDVTDYDGGIVTIDLSKVLYLQEFDFEQIAKIAQNPSLAIPESLAIAQNVQGNPNVLKTRTTITFIGGTSLLVRDLRTGIRARWLEMMTAGTDMLTATLRGPK